MINHTNCDHPSTSGARAKCRRARSNGTEVKVGFGPPLFSLGPPPKTKTKRAKEVDEEEDRYGQTPRDRHMECDKCGVERIAYRGTDPITHILTYVGERCRWYIARADDLVALD